MRTSRQSFTTLALTLLVSSASAGPDPGQLSWMSGRWCTTGGEQTIEEHWLPHRGDMLLGVNRTLKGDRTLSFEFLRIVLIDGKATYVAQPSGQPPTSFTRTDGGVNWVRFENRAHDFPQRIEYRRQGEALHAEIGGPGQDGREKVIAFDFAACSP